MTESRLVRNIPVPNYGGWTFLKADRNMGSWKPRAGSPNTLENYEVCVSGTWVPTVDASWLLSFRKRCPCNSNRLTWMFALLVPDRRQMDRRPKESPRLRVESQPKLGLIKT